MSSSELGHFRAVRSRSILLAVALTAAALSGGCLQPLYAESTTSIVGGSVRNALRDVEIAEIKGLTGHYLRNELAFELDGGAANVAPKRLKLIASVTDALEVVTVDFINSRADSAILVARATWSVTDIASGKIVSRGTNMVRAPYERSAQRFATASAARDAQIRAARSLATLIRGQLSADLVSF